MEKLIVYAGLWVVYFGIHSLLASTKVKEVLGAPRWYRFFYTLVSLLLLIPIIYYRLGIPTQGLFEPTLATKIPSVGLGYVAFVVFRQALKIYDLNVFVGLRQEAEPTLRTDGILSRVRHPFYTATVALGIGFFLWSPTTTNAVMVMCWFLYLPIGIHFEEKRLLKEFGEAYARYKVSTPGILPGLRSILNRD